MVGAKGTLTGLRYRHPQAPNETREIKRNKRDGVILDMESIKEEGLGAETVTRFHQYETNGDRQSSSLMNFGVIPRSLPTKLIVSCPLVNSHQRRIGTSV